MSVYEQYRDSRTSWGIGALGSVIVEVELEDGTIGVGISIGGEAACFCVENHLSRFVEGQDPTNVELIYDQMWRSTMNYGRKGLAIQAISAVDLVSSSSHTEDYGGVICKFTSSLTYFPGHMGRAWEGERCAGIRAPRWQNKAPHAVLRHHRASRPRKRNGILVCRSTPSYFEMPVILSCVNCRGAKFPLPYGPASGEQGMR